MPPLISDVWKRYGHSLLWNAPALFSFVSPKEIVTLRQFFALIDAWPEDLPAYNGQTLVVVGLESVLDSLNPHEAADWLETDLQEALHSFQSAYDTAALIFWLPGGQQRIKANAAQPGVYDWTCAAPHTETRFDLGRLLWSGAAPDARHILDPQHPNADPDSSAWIGLYLARLA